MDDKVMTTSEHRDPMTGEPGAHPVGTGIGAALGGVIAGAITGSVAGPAGTMMGAALGAMFGGLVGKGLAENIEPTAQDAYWRDNYKTRPYIEKSAKFEHYAPAFAYGVQAYARYPGRTFEDIEAALARDWHASRGESTLEWQHARPAAHDAWQRVHTGAAQGVLRPADAAPVSPTPSAGQAVPL